MMQGNMHKQTLVQIRLRYPFDLPTLAQQAGMETQIVYHVLLQKPISLLDAKKRLTALSHHTGLPLSFDLVDLITWEDHLCLWIIRTSNTNEKGHVMDSYHLVYARNQKHAAIIAYPWRSHYLQAMQFHFTPYPEGLHIDGIEIPGYPLSKREKKNPDGE